MQRTLLRPIVQTAACALIALAASACSVDIASTAGCLPGATQPCTCPGQTDSQQLCEDDGTFGQCLCDGLGDPDAVGGDSTGGGGGGNDSSTGGDPDGSDAGPDSGRGGGGPDGCQPGASCDDGDACTTNDICNQDGLCVGIEDDCEDGRSCTKDACVDGECLHDPSGCECDGDSDCDDESLCTKDTCDFPSGACSHAVDTALSCNDDNPCTSEDRCQEDGACGGTPKPCDDGVECTIDSCDTATGGCVFDGSTCPCLIDLDCDNGNPCTTGYCDTGSGSCAQLVDISAECTDNEPCTSGDACQLNGTCKGTAAGCDDFNGCTIDSCDPGTGECLHVGDETAGCNDGDLCTTGDHCTADGECTGEPKSCADDKECSVDSCEPLTGHCTNDNSTCTCASDAECDDDNPCTDDSCDSEAATCVSIIDTGNVCSDSDPCTTDDGCQLSGACSGTAKDCDDGKECSADSCNETTGACEFDTAECGCETDEDCDDGDACTVNTCDVSGGTCTKAIAAESACDDANPCTVSDVCDDAGDCAGQPVTCDDDKTCTADSCDPATGECLYDDSDCGCTSDLECADGQPCTDDSCDVSAGVCLNVPNLANPCSDGDPCTVGDACNAAGACGGAPKACDDGKDCSSDACVPETGECSFDKSDCDCEVDAECEDGKACTTDTCDVATGVCVNTIDVSNACTDGNACTDSDTCSAAGTCAGSPVVCDDDNPCTNDVCNPLSGTCDHTLALANQCSDGNPCTKNDACKLDGGCAGVSIACDDQNPCTDDSCDGETGLCTSTIDVTNGCSDGKICTVNDSCLGDGTCAGSPKVCNDDNPCTVDSCSIVNGSCTSSPTPGASCSDGLSCTVDDACTATGTCVGTGVVCNDGNACTDDACDPADGDCVATVNPSNQCTDGNPCTVGDACQESGSCAGAAKVCNDQNSCTTDSCDPASGACMTTVTAGASCTDGDPCTITDVCNAEGQCAGTDKDCSDGIDCSADSCNPANGTCSNDFDDCGCTSAADCNDNNSCTTDTCDANSGGCSNTVASGATCSDGDACTTGDTCQSNGSCVGSVVSCNDMNPCTDEKCDPASGDCLHVGNPANTCNDNNACTVNDACSAAGACAGVAKNCSDGKQCTVDSCHAGDGACVNQPTPGAGCTDNNPCTVSDTCDPAGACVGTAQSCADEDPCTDDSCDLGSGACVHAIDPTNPCTDGNPCTLNDACGAESGCAGTDKVCNDNNPCTLDTCSGTTGLCEFTVQTGAACNDGDVCTTGDVCQGDGSCRGADLECDDGDSCTDDFCNTVSGQCDATFDTTNACDDSNLCTQLDKCVSAGGVEGCAGTPTDCGDGNDCTDDSCTAAAGCVHTPAPPASACSDGDDCSVADACEGTQCVGATPCLSWAPCPTQKAAHFLFGTQGEALLEDSSGHGFSGTAEGVSPFACNGIWGARFGEGSTMVVSDQPEFDGASGLTAMAWVRSSSTKVQRIVGKAALGVTNGWELRLTAANRAAFRVNQKSFGSTYEIVSDPYPDDGMTWVHVAATYDGERARIYLNGDLQADVAWGVPIATNVLPLTVGAEPDGFLWFDGVLADVRVYQVALCEASIASIASDDKYYTSLAGRWKFDEGMGNVATDLSQNGNHAMLASSSWVEGASGYGYQVDGPAVVKDNASLDITNGITLAAWFRSDQQSQDSRIISKAIKGQVDGFELGMRITNRLYVQFNEGSEGNQYRLQHDLPTFGTWQHAAATWDGDQIRLFLDGVQVGQTNGSGFQLQPNGLDLSLGAEAQTGNSQFKGAIDDVVVVHGVLCDEDIAALAAQGGAGQPPEITSGPVTPVPVIHGDTLLRPQHSRSFVHGGAWHAVFADEQGLAIWRMETVGGSNAWVPVAVLDHTPLLSADVHYRDGKLAIVAYNAFNTAWFHYLEDLGSDTWKYTQAGAYAFDVPGAISVTTALDSTGRAWVVYAAQGKVWTHWADPPYDSFSDNSIASGLSNTDAAMVLYFPTPSPMIGVFWGDTAANLYFFRAHMDGNGPAQFMGTESVGKNGSWGDTPGMVSNQFHGVVLDDGTALLSVRTNFLPYLQPSVLLVVRNPVLGWIPLDQEWVVTYEPASNPVVFANSSAGQQAVGYIEAASGAMALSRAPAAGGFSKAEVLIPAPGNGELVWTAGSDRSVSYPQPAFASDSNEPGTIYTEFVDLELIQ